MLIHIRKIVSRSAFTPAFITWLVCSFISQTALAGQLLVDKSVAGVKPMVLTAPSGVPLVNIATPGSNGVSKNQYTQFDVNSEGVILNNSINPVNTTLGGYVPGNSQLGDYSARVILNQVNGTSPSSLNGYLEVAGQNAQVIVANENGITCNGCGFINTSAGTLTTGQANTGVSGVSSFTVEQGLLQINGLGLNASNTPELTLMGRHIKVDAPIHAQALNLVAGVNEVTANNTATQINSHIPASSNVAIDTSALGGMYANRIHLVSTEAGLGVNVAGTVLAQAGTLTLDSQGKLTVSALVQANTQLNVEANEGVSLLSSGQLEAKESVVISTQKTSEIAGSITGLTTISLTGKTIEVSKTGDISAQSKLSLRADQLAALQGTLASQTDITVTAADVSASGSISANNDLSLVVGESIEATAGHQLMAGGDLRLTANTVALENGRVEASEQVHVQANTSTQLDQQVLLGQQVTLENQAAGKTDTTTFNNTYVGASQGLTLQTKTLVINQSQKQNSAGSNVYSVVSDGDTQLVVDTLQDNGSQIYSHGTLNITAEQAINSSGTWVAGNALDNASNITITSGGNTHLSQATVDASGNVTLNTQGLSATQSRLQAKNTLALNVQGTSAAQAADLSQSTLVANDISITAEHLNAAGTQASATHNINLGTTRLQNVGQWVANNDFSITTTDDLTLNSDEYLKAGQTLSVQANSHNLTNAGVLQGTTIEASAHTLTNTGEIAATTLNAAHQSAANRSLNQPIHTVVNQGNVLVTNLDLALDTFTNTGGIVQSDDITLSTRVLTNQDLTNADGTISQGVIQAKGAASASDATQGALSLTATDQLTHADTATLEATGNLALNGQTVTLNSRVNSDQNVTVTGTNISVSGQLMAGVIATQQAGGSITTTYNDQANLTLNASEQLTLNANSQIGSAGVLNLSANTLTGTNTTLNSVGDSHLQVDEQLTLSNSQLNSQNLTIHGQLDNSQNATRVGDVTLTDTNVQTRGNLALVAGKLSVTQSQLKGVDGNNHYGIKTNGTSDYQLSSLALQNAGISGQGTTQVNTTGNVDVNNSAWVVGTADTADTTGTASSLTLTSGGKTTVTNSILAASDDLTLNTQGLTITQSRLQAKNTLALNVQGTSAAQAADLSQSTLVANDISITAEHLNADATQASATHNINLGTTRLQNVGQWVANNDLSLTTTDDLTLNSDEYLKAGQTLSVQANSHNLTNAGVLQGTTIEASAHTLTNTGEIAATTLNAAHQSAANRSLNQPIHTVVNQGNVLVTNLDLALDTFTNTGGIVQSDDITLSTRVLTNQDLTNADGTISQGVIQAKGAASASDATQGALSLTATDQLTHADTATLEATGNLALNGQTVTLNSRVNSDQNVTVTGTNISVSGQLMAGVIATQQAGGSITTTYNDQANLTLNASEQLTLNANSQIGSAGVLNLSANTLTGTNTTLNSVGDSHLQVDEQLTLSNSQLNSQNLTIHGQLDNSQNATRVGDVTLTDTNVQTRGNLALVAGKLSVTQSQLKGVDGNNHYGIKTNGTSDYQLSSLALQNAGISGQGTTQVNTTGNVDVNNSAWVVGTADTADTTGTASSLTLTSGGKTTVTNSILAASDDLTLNTQGLTITQSRLQAKNTLALNVQGTSAAQAADLSQSTLVANDISITAEHLNADATQASATHNINLGTTRLQNVGQWVANNDLSITTTDDLTLNSDEYLKAGQTLSVQANSHNLTNAGVLQGTTIEASAQTLTNTGEIAATTLNAAHQSAANRSLNQPIHTVVNQGNVLVTNLDLALDTFTNTGGIVQSDDITLSTNHFLAQSHTRSGVIVGSEISAKQDLTITATQSLHSQGVLAAGDDITLAGQDVTLRGSVASGVNTGDSKVTNTEGDLQVVATNGLYSPAELKSGGHLSVTGQVLNAVPAGSGATNTGALATEINLSQLWAGKDTTLNLTGDYAHGASHDWTIYGDLDLNVSGAFTNAKDLSAQKSLTINAASITNNSGMRLATNDAVGLISLGDITNNGTIEANTITFNAINATNNDSIIGDNVTMNLSGNFTQDGSNKVLAAAENLTVNLDGTYTNAHGALTYAGQNMAIGGESNTRATAIINDSATIEADGNIQLAANSVTNRREAPTFSESIDTTNHKLHVEEDSGSFPSFISVTKTDESFVFKGDYTNDNHTFQVDAGESQGVISANNDITINTSQLTNSDSRISAKQNLSIGGNTYAVAFNSTDVISGVTVTNAGASKTNYEHLQGSFRHNGWHKCGFFGTKNCDSFNYTYVLDETTNTGITAAPSTITGGSVSITARTVTNGPVTTNATASQTINSASSTSITGSSAQVQKTANASAQALSGQTQAGPVAARGLTSVAAVTQQTASSSAVEGQQVSDTVAKTKTQLTQASAQSIASTTAANGLLSATLLNLRLPNNALFTFNNTAQHGYLIESNPRFTSRDTFLSSDYMTTGINAVLSGKVRVGDGYYETRLVAQQVADLTAGQQLLEGYPTKALQYKSLMDNAIAAASPLALRPGIALTHTQINQLTQPLVWLVERDIQGPNGQAIQALVPVVYLNDIGDGELLASGAVIAGDNVRITASEAVNNRGGTIAGRQVLSIESEGDITNAQGTLTGGNVLLKAGGNVNNLAKTTTQTFGNATKDTLEGVGTIAATGNLQIIAGNDITDQAGNISAYSNLALQAGNNIDLQNVAVSTTRDGSFARSSNTQQNVSQLQSGGNLSLVAGNDITAAGTQFESDGSIRLQAGNNLALTAVQEEASKFQGDSRNFTQSESSTANTVSLAANNNISLLAGVSPGAGGGNLTLEGTAVTSEAGDVLLQATGDVTLAAARDTASSSSKTTSTSRGILSSSTTTTQTSQSSDTAKVTELVANGALQIVAGKNVTSQGSQVLAEGSVLLDAQGDVLLDVATNSTTQTQQTSKSQSGLSFSGGGLFIGSRSEQAGKLGDQSQNVASTLIGDQVVVRSQGTVTLAATQAAATGEEGTLLVLAQDIKDKTVSNTTQQTNTSQSQSSGISIGSNSKLITSAVALDNTLTQYQGARSDKLKTALAVQGFDQLSSLNQAANAGDLVDDITDAGVSISFGQSSSQSSQTSTTSTALTSSLEANTVQLEAQNDITLTGADITANTATISAIDGKINLLAAQNTQTTQSESSSQGSSIGVGISTKNGTQLTISANQAQGSQNSQSTQHQETVIKAQNLTLSSGTDTVLTGAVLQADRIEGTIGGDLIISSQQDTSTYTSDSESVGVSVGIPLLPGAGTANLSGNASQAQADANFQAVQEQTGLFAGEEGFNLTVAGTTTLNAGALASTADESKNQLTTDDLQISTLDNTSEFDIKSQSLSLSTSGGNSAGQVDESGSQSNTTQAVLAAGNIEVNQKPDFDPEEIDGLTQDANDNQALQNNFSEEQVQIAQESVQASQILGTLAPKIVGDIAQTKVNQAAQLALQADQETDPIKSQQLKQQAQKLLTNWGEGGDLRVALHTLTGLANGDLAGAAASFATAKTIPEIAKALDEAGYEGTEKDTILLAISAAIGSVADGTQGAINTVGQTANNYLKHEDEMWRVELKGKISECNNDQACDQTDLDTWQTEYDALETLRFENQGKVTQACGNNPTSSACNNALEDFKDALNTYDNDSKLASGTLYPVYLNSFNVSTVAGREPTTTGTIQGVLDQVNSAGKAVIGTAEAAVDLVALSKDLLLGNAQEQAAAVDSINQSAAALATAIAKIPDLPQAVYDRYNEKLAQADELESTNPYKAAQIRSDLYSSIAIATLTAAQGGLLATAKKEVVDIPETPPKVVDNVPEGIPSTNTQANAGTRAGAPDAEVGNSAPLITDASPFNTRGIDPNSPSVQAVKSDLYNQYKSSGLSDDLAKNLTNNNINSGSTIPTKRVVVQGEMLYKFVPSGKAPGRSSYYFTKKEFENFKSNPQKLAQEAGLPYKNFVGNYDVYAIKPKANTKPVVFESKVAEIQEGAYHAQGGAKQTIVPNLKDWDVPKKVEEIKAY